MLNFSIFSIPVHVQWFFWLTSFLLAGGLRMEKAEDWVFIFLKIGIILISIIVHELGHALASMRWGGRPTIELHGLGGVTFLGGEFTRWQHLAISFSGPFASLSLAGISYLLLKFTELPMEYALGYLFWVNLIWTAFNLLPVLPMDGGQILRGFLGPKHERKACIIGMITAVLVALWAFQTGQYLMTVLLGFFAWLNYKGSLRQGGVQ